MRASCARTGSGADGKPRDSARFSVTAAEWPAVRQHLEALTARYTQA